MLASPIPFPAPASTPKPTIKTAQSIKGLPVPETGTIDYFVQRAPGSPVISLRISAGGVRTWNLHFRLGGKPKRFKLGRFPTMGLAAAQEAALEAQRKVDKGIDPGKPEPAPAPAVTFGQVAADFLERHSKRHKRSWREDERMINSRDLVGWKDRAITEITRRDVRGLLASVAEPPRNAPIAANRLHALLSKIFNWAIEQEAIEHSPLTGVRKPGKERKRERVLTEDEIRRVWAACEAYKHSQRISVWFRLRLITAQRGGEVLQLRWEDISGDWWTLPGAWAKNGQAHRVFLSPKAKALISELPKADAGWLFPKSEMGDYKHVANRIAVETRANIQDFGGHDLRRTAATIMATGGVPRFVVARVLNHAESSVTAIYDRASYDAEKQAALSFWDRQLSAILDGRTAASVGRFTMTG